MKHSFYGNRYEACYYGESQSYRHYVFFKNKKEATDHILSYAIAPFCRIDTGIPRPIPFNR
jgi:hypothetical protein